MPDACVVARIKHDYTRPMRELLIYASIKNRTHTMARISLDVDKYGMLTARLFVPQDDVRKAYVKLRSDQRFFDGDFVSPDDFWGYTDNGLGVTCHGDEHYIECVHLLEGEGDSSLDGTTYPTTPAAADILEVAWKLRTLL